jgi:hypothetical protein
MQVLAYCLKPPVDSLGSFVEIEKWLPAIPDGLVTLSGFVWKNEIRLEDSQFKTQDLPVPLDVPEGSWVGVEDDGTCHVLAASDEAMWRISRATRAIEESYALFRENPIQSVCALHAASTLMGVKFASLQSALAQARKSPDEPLEATIRALVEDLAKLKQQSGR